LIFAQRAELHEMQHPGYVQEIYNPFHRSVRMSIAAANPGFTAEQVKMAARQDEDALFKSALRQGRDPHDIIHAQAGLRGIYSTAERNYMAELDRQARAKAEHNRQQAERADCERRRAQVEAQLSNASWRDLSRDGGIRA
jgi:hypothetical protein